MRVAVVCGGAYCAFGGCEGLASGCAWHADVVRWCDEVMRVCLIVWFAVASLVVV